MQKDLAVGIPEVIRLLTIIADKVTSGTWDKWSQPEGITKWAQKFDVHYNTMRTWLQTQAVRNVKVSDRRYKIALEDLPGE